MLNSAVLSESDLPGVWAVQDHLDLHPTPFGFQPEILGLLRQLSYEAALFIEFSQSLGTEDPQFIEQSLFLYPDEAAAGKAYEVATAESALPFFFGGWPRAYSDFDPSEVKRGPSDIDVGQRSTSFSSSCPTPGRPELGQDCTGIFAQAGSLLMVLVASDPPPVDTVDLAQGISARVAEELALALADSSAPLRQSARMTLQAEDVALYEFSTGVSLHQSGFIYEEADKSEVAQSMRVLGGSSVTFSDAHSRSRLTNSVTIYDSVASAKEGFAFEGGEGRPANVEGTALEAGDESLAYYGATGQVERSSLTLNEDFVIIRLGEVVATIRVSTSEGVEPPIPTSDIVRSLVNRISAELGS